jgi:hypothetical protein
MPGEGGLRDGFEGLMGEGCQLEVERKCVSRGKISCPQSSDMATLTHCGIHKTPGLISLSIVVPLSPEGTFQGL